MPVIAWLALFGFTTGLPEGAFPRDGWTVRREETGAPRILTGPGVPLSEAGALISAVARLASVDPADLVAEPSRRVGDRVGLRVAQTWRGAPVEGATLDLVVQNGRISWVRTSLGPVLLDGEPRPGEIALSGADRSWRWATRSDEGHDTVYRDRTGAVVDRRSRRLPLDVTYHERTPDGPLVSAPARNVTVTDGITVALTDDAGQTALAGALDVLLDGPFVTVVEYGEIASAQDVDDGLLDLGIDLGPSPASAFAHFQEVRAWLERREPTHPFLAHDVGIQLGAAFAAYADGDLFFGYGSDVCADDAEIADAVYHEYGHGIHDYGLVSGAMAYDVSEGSADYVAATINDDPTILLGVCGQDITSREIETDRVWPDDQGESHVSGLVWAGFWWDVRTELVDELGYEAGTALADGLFLDTLTYGPSMTDYEAMLAADDDDGDPTNGTPNDCLLLRHAREHGLVPDLLETIRVIPEHAGDLPSGQPDDPPTRIEFRLTGAPCADVDLDGVRLHYAIDPDPDAELDAIAFVDVVPTRDGERYTAEIPAVPAGSRVVYHVTWGSPGAAVLSSHHGLPDDLFEYRVGDQVDLWCDDFESGQGDWSTGGGALDGAPEAGVSEFGWGSPPIRRGYGATVAFSGSSVLGQRLDDGEPLAPSNEQHVSSPAIDLREAHPSLLVLSYQRWLSVGSYQDTRARVVVDGLDEVWVNPVSVPILDGGWIRRTHDLRSLAGVAETRVHFTSATSGSALYDGWNLDDVCIRTLDDPGRHYRDVGLTASDDGTAGVEVRWRAPWVVPLRETRLVRKQGGLPTGPEDGETLLVATPAPGESGVWTDSDVAAGESWTYALFASDGTDRPYGAVDGENADGGGVTAAELPLAGPGATGGCGCDQGRLPAGGAWLLCAVWLVGRRGTATRCGPVSSRARGSPRASRTRSRGAGTTGWAGRTGPGWTPP